MSEKETHPIIPINSTISPVVCKNAFNELNLKEKLYAYYFTRASWSGSKICYFQRSYESPALFYLFQKIFLTETPQSVRRNLEQKGFSEIEIKQIFVFIGAFFQNCGNFKGEGDCKFIPEIPKDRFQSFIQQTKAYQIYQKQFDYIWEHTNFELYAYDNPYQIIGFINNQGISSFYSSNVTQQNAEQIGRFMEQQDISLSPLNTRLIKHSETEYEILIASITKQLETQNLYNFEGLNIKISYGCFSSFLQTLNQYLAKSLEYCGNEHQENMIKAYLKHFENGSIEDHKTSQRHWIKDKGPIIETNIGFVESYLDPLKVRAEFEGFVSIVNKQESIKLEDLVSKAESIIPYLPWPKEFEVSKFTKPDFTSLEVLTFATSMIPWGINIPNYDDIRQSEGFKNVNLGNAYPVRTKQNTQFIDEINDLYCKHAKDSLFVMVALHELLGHGSGKLFQRNDDGSLNFDQDNLIHPIFNTKIETFYDKNETWHSKFGEDSSGYEECRADAVAFYLSCYQECLEILVPGQNLETYRNIVYIMWVDNLLIGIKGLEFYNPELKKWGQAHAQASYAIVQVLKEKGDDLIKFQKCEKDGKPYFNMILNKEKIWTVGKEVIRKFLMELQVYKSTADAERGLQFFNKYTEVDQEMLEIRDIVLNVQLPSPLQIQGDVKITEDSKNVEYLSFENTFEGLINSFIIHYQGQVDDVYDEWVKYQSNFRIKRNN